MSWAQSKASARRLGLLALVSIAAAAPAAANVLVVRSSGPSAAQYPAGRSLPDNAQIRLQDNDIVVLLSAGGTRTFRGPGTFSPSQAAGPRVAGNSAGARVGAVRSAGIDPSMPQPSIWQIDVSQSGTACLTSAASATLWRPDSGEAGRFSIRGPSGAQQVSWPAGHATASWPAGLPLATDTEYQISQVGAPVPTTVRVKLIGAVTGDLTAVADALIRNGCTEQLDLLVATAPERP